jgi:hypothetical protein
VTVSVTVNRVLRDAITHITRRGTPVFTFALYLDHESGAVAVCVDTEENSMKVVAGINRYNAKHFRAAVEGGDLKAAALWQANIGRSLSLGDFAFVDIARADLPDTPQDAKLELVLVRSLVDVQSEVLALADAPERVLFVCSSAGDEVGYVWSAGVA